MKKVLSLFLSVVTLLSITAGLDFSAYSAELTTGKCGKNVYYSFDSETGILTINGTGNMYSAIEYDSPFEGFDIKKVIIENGVTNIGEYMFSCCSSLTSITIPDSVTSIDHCAFCGCSGLTNIIIPNSIKKIGVHAFSDTAYYNDTSNWLNDVLYIDNCLIEAKETLSGNYNIEDGTRIIADSAFLNCTGLTSVIIPDSVISIGHATFIGCSSLTSITIPDSVTSIGASAFSGCSSLTSITIPDSVIIINYEAFYNCSALSDVYYNGTENQWNRVSIQTGNDPLLYATMHYNVCNHKYDSGTIVKNPTCTEYGQIKYTCTQCGESQTFTTSALSPLGHNFGEYISNNDATYDADGTKTAVCTRCGAKDTVIDEGSKLVKEPDLTNFIIKTVSLSLESSITMNFKVLKSAVVDFDNPYVVFTCGGNSVTATEFEEQGDYYVFSYTGISPQLMNDDVAAVLHASYNGIDYASPEKVMSVKTYAYTMLERYNSDDYAELRTLLVDLLNYGAVSQKYVGYQTDNLVNADLTDEQKSWGTNTAPTFENIRDYNYKTIDNPTSKWVGSGLVLNNSVTVRAKFTADSIDNKTVVITCGKGTFTYTKDDFVKDKDGNYYVYCDEIFANEMSEEILLTVYDNGVQCSNTMRFSIESYAKLVHDSYSGTVMDELTTAMMRYGNSAKAFGA